MGGPAGASPAATEFCRRFEIETPVVNAPMAFIAGGALAGAVASAGGLGLLGGGYGDLGWIREQRRLAGEAQVGVGLINWVIDDRPGLVESLADDGITTFFLSFGDPSAAIGRLRGRGARIICQVQTVPEAVAAVEAGADAVVAQGHESGGHGRDNERVDDLLVTVLATVGPAVPVLAAGAMTDGSDLARVWSHGAAGVVVGTRMYATIEALDTEAAKARLVAGSGEATVRTTVFDVIRGPEWPPGYTGRSVVNATTEAWHNRIDGLRAEVDGVRHDYRRAVADDDLDRRVVWAGTGLDRIDDVRSAADLVRTITRDAAHPPT